MPTQSQTIAREVSSRQVGVLQEPARVVPTDSSATANRILILDGNTRSALAATRSLGARGVNVLVGDHFRRPLAGASKHCAETIQYPDPGRFPQAFISSIKTECVKRGIGLILPMAEITTAVVLQHRSQIEPLIVPYPDFSAFDQVTNKCKVFQLAQTLHIPVPKTEFVDNALCLPAILRNLTFPVVLKPCRSVIYSSGRWTSASVRYARSRRELEETVARHECFALHPFLIQEYISGEACGIFALYDRGQVVRFFAHRRLRENPPSGGVSVLCESTQLPPAAVSIAQKLLDSVGWHGVAMVEFKISSDGIPHLIEINGRFWGSLQLAIDAGVDFPWLVYQLATGQKLDDTGDYQIGVRSRWLLGDMASLIKALFIDERSLVLPGSRLMRLLGFLNVCDRSRGDVNRWGDLKPFCLEIRHTLEAVVRRIAGAARETSVTPTAQDARFGERLD